VIDETGGDCQYTTGSSSVAQSGDDRLPLFRQEFHQRHLWEWTLLAEDELAHDGRKLTAYKWAELRTLPEDVTGGSTFSNFA
jgi:hypothetical protein